MKAYSIAGQIFLALALLGWIGWIVTRFTGPIFRVSYEGLHELSITCLIFAIAISLIKLAFSEKKGV